MFDVDEINKEIPYKISLKEYGCVSFTTDSKLTYNVLFLSLCPNDSYHLHDINFYELIVEVIGKIKKINKTIKLKKPF
jgi:hypothetical protein